MTRLKAVAALLVIALLWPAFASGLSISEEAKEGQKFKVLLRRLGGLAQDPVANVYLSSIGRALAAQAGPMPFQPSFYLGADKELNAFAGPGAVIVLTEGLALTMDSVDELAAVLGHELAHAAHRHIAQQMDQQAKVGLATLGGVLAGVLAGAATGSPELSQAITLGSVATGLSKMLAYSRDQEFEADQVGWRYAEAAGYDVRAGLVILEKIRRASNLMGPNPPPYLTTHPALDDRIAFLSNLHPESSAQPNRAGEADFPWFKARLLARSPQGQQNFKGQEGPLALYGQGLIALKANRVAEAVSLLGQAYQQAPEALGVAYSYAQALRLASRRDEAVEALRRYLPYKPDDPAVLLFLGQLYLEAKKPDKALESLKEAAKLVPDDPEILRQMGVAHGQAGQLSEAHLSLAWAFTWQGERDKALRNFELALSKAADPLRRDEVIKARQAALEILGPPPMQ